MNHYLRDNEKARHMEANLQYIKLKLSLDSQCQGQVTEDLKIKNNIYLS